LARLEIDLQQKCSDIQVLSACLTEKTDEFEAASRARAEAVSQQLRESETLLRQGLERELLGEKEEQEKRLNQIRSELESRIAEIESDYSSRGAELDKAKKDLALKMAELEEMKSSSLTDLARIKESMKAEKEAALAEQRARYKARTEEVRFPIPPRFSLL